MKEDIKLEEGKAKMKRYCQHCKHTISFYAFEPDKKLCSWCHKYTYKDDKAKFMDKLNIERKKLK